MEVFAGGGVWLGMGLGLFAGMGVQAWLQARRNLRTARDGMPKLKDAVSASRGRASRRVLVLILYAAIVMMIAVVMRAVG